MKVAILGAAGRMGRMLCEMASSLGCEIAAKVDVVPGFDSAFGHGVEGVIDFSHHSAVPGAVAKAAELSVPYVLGTTGLSKEEQKCVEEAALKIPVVQSGNYSLGINVLLDLVRRAAEALGPGYDIEIAEMHHRHKKDAPSGTALMLARAADIGGSADFIYGRSGQTPERPQGEIAIHALRGGGVIGDHTVVFAGERERVELVHRAQSREAFAEGAFRALLWAKGRAPGLYSMRDVLGLSGKMKDR